MKPLTPARNKCQARQTELRLPRLACLMVAVLSLSSCTDLSIDDCGGKDLGNGDLTVLGIREARIRSSHWRMLLADVPSAAARFAPYAAMSALAYAEDEQQGGKDPKTGKDNRSIFEEQLVESGADGANWIPVAEVDLRDKREDDVGLFYRVWQKEADNSIEVVIAFRGTEWEVKDWLYGNLHWLTRFLPIDDQYTRAQQYSSRVFKYFQDLQINRPGVKVRFYTTGHSLGGGLAQHVLYSFPTIVDQVFAFDPTPVTGYWEQPIQNQVSACECDRATLNNEPRIYRVYDVREVLSNVRIFHKIFFDPERHMQEVRFENKESHSINGLALYLLTQAKSKKPSEYIKPWYAGIGNVRGSGESCTAAFEKGQQESCSVKVSASDPDRCPQ